MLRKIRAKTIIIVLLLLVGVSVIPQTASAHGLVAGGAQVFEVEAGPYPVRVEATVPTGAPTRLILKVLPLQPTREEMALSIEAVHREQQYRSDAYVSTIPGGQSLVAMFDIAITHIGNWDLELRIATPTTGEGFVAIPVTILPVTTPPLTIPLFVGFALLAVTLVVSTVWLSAPMWVRTLNNGFFLVNLTTVIVLGGLSVWPGIRVEHNTPMPLPLPYITMNTTVVADADTIPQLQFSLFDGSTGLVADDLVVHHQALVHLIVLSDDNTQFFHLHPARIAPGKYAVNLTGVPAGDYMIAAEFERIHSGSQVLRASITVPDVGQTAGTAQAPIPFQSGNSMRFGDYDVVVATDGPLVANQTAVLSVEVLRQGQPVPALDYWLGMQGHLLVRSQDQSVFGHVHAASTMNDDFQPVSAVGNTVSFVYAFPAAGTYTLWIQVMVDAQIITVPIEIVVNP